MVLVGTLLELAVASTLPRLNLLKLRMKVAPKPSVPCKRHCPSQGPHDMYSSCQALLHRSIGLLDIRPACTRLACKSCPALLSGGVRLQLVAATQAGTLSPPKHQTWTCKTSCASAAQRQHIRWQYPSAAAQFAKHQTSVVSIAQHHHDFAQAIISSQCEHAAHRFLQ